MKLGFAETPDYEYMIGLFESCIEDTLKDKIKFVVDPNDPDNGKKLTRSKQQEKECKKQDKTENQDDVIKEVKDKVVPDK